MKTGIKLPASVYLLLTPLAAYADPLPETGHTVYAFVGGFAGGLLGALLACWLCNRRRGSKDNSDPKKY